MAVADLKNKAKEAFRRKNYDLAVEVYLEALRFDADDPQTVEGFFQAAKKARETRGKGFLTGMLSRASMTGTRDPAKRMAACFRGLSKNPDDKSLLLALGDAASEAGAYEAGIAALKQATQSDPQNATAWKQLGEMLGRKGRLKEALEALSEAIKIDPKDQDAIKLRKNLAAEGALKISGYETARSSRELMKDQAEATRLEAQQRIQLTPEHALSEVEKVKQEIEKEPQNARLHIRLGELHLQRNEEEGAIAAFQEAIRIDPRNYDLSVRVGDIRLRALQREAESARDALAATPDDADAKARRDAAYRALLEGRLAEYERRVKEHPLDLPERFRLGRTLLALGRTDEAAAEFQQTVRDPNLKIDSLMLLAQCFEKKNLLGLAVKKLEEALTDFPTLATPRAKDVNYAYADMLERKGEKEKARDIFERIYEVDITYRDVSQRLERLTG
jgi:tetratricopeptide (TPR) repeat protein